MASRRVKLLLPALVAAVVAIGCAPRAHAANTCPWMNESTASGLLGGDATGVYTAPAAQQPAECLFTLHNADGARTLRVTVEVTTEARAQLAALEQQCKVDASALVAIGNEAVMCSADDARGHMGERAVGRVRDQLFTITLATPTMGNGAFHRAELKTAISVAAEQVAGNLF